MDKDTRLAINKSIILIQRKRYHEARVLLRAGDDPKAT